jgi:hypothetical protein
MKATISLNLPTLNLNKPQMIAIAQDILAIIKIRIYKGLDYNLSKFRAYSTRPIYIGYKSTTYKRLKPKGGVKKPNSMFFAGGYAEYKDKSRKRSNAIEGQTASVDLTLSGMMLQNFVVLEATNTKFTIGLLPPVQDYGYAVNQDRGFIGLADKEVDQLVQIVKANLLGE